MQQTPLLLERLRQLIDIDRKIRIGRVHGEKNYLEGVYSPEADGFPDLSSA